MTAQNKKYSMHEYYYGNDSSKFGRGGRIAIIILVISIGMAVLASKGYTPQIIIEKIKYAGEHMEDANAGLGEYAKQSDSTEQKGYDYNSYIYDQIYTSIDANRSTIQLTIPSTGSTDVISDAFSKVYRNHPEFFWITGGASSYGITTGAASVCTVTINTRCNKNDIPVMRSELDSVVNSIVASASANCNTDYEKALWVHDYLVQNCEYDYSTLISHEMHLEDGKSLAFTSYGCLVNNKAVCDGYTKAYMLIMNKLGVECGYVCGTGTNAMGAGSHSWNYIRLDDGYYMVDVTWDDPLMIGYSDGSCSREYFCITTDMILEDHEIDAGQDIPICNGGKYISY